MRSYLFILLCCFSGTLFGQTANYPVSMQDFSTEDVNFKSAGVILSGTIFKPKHSYASVVLVHGSGKETRMVGMASLLAEVG